MLRSFLGKMNLSFKLKNKFWWMRNAIQKIVHLQILVVIRWHSFKKLETTSLDWNERVGYESNDFFKIYTLKKIKNSQQGVQSISAELIWEQKSDYRLMLNYNLDQCLFCQYKNYRKATFHIYFYFGLNIYIALL